MEMTVPNRKAMLLGICISMAGGKIISSVQWISEANAYAGTMFDHSSLDIPREIMENSIYPPFNIPIGVIVYEYKMDDIVLLKMHEYGKWKFCYSNIRQLKCVPKIP
jgi:hypothetical protein